MYEKDDGLVTLYNYGGVPTFEINKCLKSSLNYDQKPI
jgi:hypothetical protein